MQEVALSNDLKQIEFEIKQYEKQTGENLLEIGRRINWVKQNNLDHGEFLPFLKRINISKSYAEMFMKVANDHEIGNSQPDGNLGITVLYELTKIPNEMRNEPQQLDSGETKKPVDMTRREIQELNRKLKQSEEANKTLDGLLSEKADTISALEQQVKNKPKPEVVEKTVTKEVKPSDYDELKREAEIAGDLRKRNEFIEKQYQNLLDQRQQVNQDASKMQELEEQINNLHGQLNEKQKHELAYKRTSEFIKKANQMLDQISPLVYAYDYEDLDDQSQAYVELRKLITRVEKWANDLSKVIGDKQIIEGDFINE